MKTRLLAAIFVVCCFLLCGLILRRQIAAHPLPPETAKRSFEDSGDPQEQERFLRGMDGWKLASPALAALAHEVVGGQIAALKAGDGVKAWSYQSRSLHRTFGSPAGFMQNIAVNYPEFAHPRRMLPGPVLTDISGQQVQAFILLEGDNGNQIRADYHLVREGGQLKVSGVQTRPRLEERR